MKWPKSKLLRWLIGILILGGMAGVYHAAKQRQYHLARSAWKHETLPTLASLTNEVVRSELEKLTNASADLEFEWIGDQVMVMQDRSFLRYAYRHRGDSFGPHFFLAHTSDGRWLYSSYHFCNHMTMIAGERIPKTINEFKNRFWVREFDGRSDECLRKTS